MPKILHLRTVTGHGGGPEKTLLNSPRFISNEYQLMLAYIRPAGDIEFDLPERAARLGVSLVDIPERGPIDFRTVRRLSQLIQTLRRIFCTRTITKPTFLPCCWDGGIAYP